MSDRKPSDKEVAFAHAFIETGCAADAYRRAYKADAMSDNAVRVEAHRVLHRPNVSLIVETLRAKNAVKHDITIETLTQMLKEDRDLARQIEDPAAAIKAIEQLAKLHGLVIERRHVTSDNKHSHTQEPVSRTAAWAANLLGIGETDPASPPLPN